VSFPGLVVTPPNNAPPTANKMIVYPLILGNYSMRRLQRLLLVPYLLHPCSRGLFPVEEGTQI
jgi:hypothetical protein